MVVEADTREVCLHGATPSLECIFPRRLSRVTYSFICALVPCVRGFFNIYESPRLLFFFQFLNRFFFFFSFVLFFRRCRCWRFVSSHFRRRTGPSSAFSDLVFLFLLFLFFSFNWQCQSDNKQPRKETPTIPKSLFAFALLSFNFPSQRRAKRTPIRRALYKRKCQLFVYVSVCAKDSSEILLRHNRVHQPSSSD